MQRTRRPAVNIIDSDCRSEMNQLDGNRQKHIEEKDNRANPPSFAYCKLDGMLDIFGMVYFYAFIITI